MSFLLLASLHPHLLFHLLLASTLLYLLPFVSLFLKIHHFLPHSLICILLGLLWLAELDYPLFLDLKTTQPATEGLEVRTHGKSFNS
jgi:hypothetical protein